jgi:hypothetical protein
MDGMEKIKRPAELLKQASSLFKEFNIMPGAVRMSVLVIKLYSQHNHCNFICIIASK